MSWCRRLATIVDSDIVVTLGKVGLRNVLHTFSEGSMIDSMKCELVSTFCNIFASDIGATWGKVGLRNVLHTVITYM